jgi:hypothetical protein
LHDSVLVPEVPSVTLVGERVQVRPVLGETLALRVTVPVKPRTLVTTMVDVPAAPVLAVTLDGLDVIVKSWTVIVTAVACTSDPLVPVTVTV